MAGRAKNTITLLLLLLAGVVLGGLISKLTAGIDFLSWLSYGESFGLSAVSLDLAVVQLSFSVNFSLNVAVIIGLIIAFFIYRKWF